MIVLRKLMDLSITARDKAIAWLLIGAIFFAMRSCEYLRTCANEESKRTKILRTRNLKFKKDGKILPHSSEDLHKADMVIITFEFQKNNLRNQTIHMYSTDDELLNPVIAWAMTVRRIWSTIPEASGDTRICAFFDDQNRIIDFDANHIRPKLRAVVELMGEHVLGFSKEDIGLHSIRAGGAMAMFLSGVVAIIIQRVGRWSSLAFLEYIREQVESFTLGVSQKMLLYEEFHHLNEKESNKIDNKSNQISTENGQITEIPFMVHYSKGVLRDNTRGASEL
jgi:hypothetical protein